MDIFSSIEETHFRIGLLMALVMAYCIVSMALSLCTDVLFC